MTSMNLQVARAESCLASRAASSLEELAPEPQASYYRARYCDPASGRFVSEDPNVLGATRSMYAYVDNEPSGYLDPPGLNKQKKEKPMPALLPGVGKDQADAIAIGYRAALKRLKGGDCAKFFGCEEDAAKQLATIQWGVFTDKKRPDVLAHTWTDSDKAEFNTASGVFDNKDPIWRSPNRYGLNPRYDFGYSESLMAFLMLHELAHHFPATGFKPDAGPGLEAVNENNSLMLIRACFGDAQLRK